MKIAFLKLMILCLFLISCSSLRTQQGNYFSNYSMTSTSLLFDPLVAQDSLGRQIDFYLSNQDLQKLPLVLFVQGSGCVSHFRKKADGAIGGGYQNVLLKLVKGKAHVLVVEKPSVKFLDENPTPGQAQNCSDEFNSQHTLENWTIALNTALEYVIKLPKIDSSKIVVIGHSEGAISTASLGIKNSKITHLGLLSGSGVSQLFDFVVNQDQSVIGDIYSKLDLVMSNPDNYKDFLWGHPYKRWASFFRNSTVEFLKQTHSQIYLENGTKDTSVPIQSFDAGIVELKRMGKSIIYKRIENADHSLNLPSETSPKGLERAFGNIISWAQL